MLNVIYNCVLMTQCLQSLREKWHSGKSDNTDETRFARRHQYGSVPGSSIEGALFGGVRARANLAHERREISTS